MYFKELQVYLGNFNLAFIIRLHVIVNQAQIQEEMGVSKVVCGCVCEWLDTHRRLDTERVLHHT